MILPSPRTDLPAVVRIGGVIAVVYCQSVNLNAELLTSGKQSFCPTTVRLAGFQIRLGPAVRKENSTSPIFVCPASPWAFPGNPELSFHTRTQWFQYRL